MSNSSDVNMFSGHDQSEYDCDCRFPHYGKAFVCNGVSCSDRRKSTATHTDEILKCSVCVTSHGTETKSANRMKFTDPVSESKYESASRWSKLSKHQKVELIRKHKSNKILWSRISIIQKLKNVEFEVGKILHHNSFLEKHQLVLCDEAGIPCSRQVSRGVPLRYYPSASFFQF